MGAYKKWQWQCGATEIHVDGIWTLMRLCRVAVGNVGQAFVDQLGARGSGFKVVGDVLFWEMVWPIRGGAEKLVQIAFRHTFPTSDAFTICSVPYKR